MIKRILNWFLCQIGIHFGSELLAIHRTNDELVITWRCGYCGRNWIEIKDIVKT